MYATVDVVLKHGQSSEIIDRRRCKNAVMQGGANLIANLFTGQGAPISHMAVGTSSQAVPETFDLSALEVDSNELSGDTETEIGADDFSIEVDDVKRLIKVRVRTTLPESAAVGTVREAGLLSKNGADSVLYNRITFDPISKKGDHELSLFWEVTFPYGDLQWF